MFSPTMDDVPFEIKSVLGRVKLSREATQQLDVGDMIFLDQSLDQPVDVYIGKKGVMQGYIGVKQGHKAIKIEVINE